MQTLFIWLRDGRYNVEPEEIDVARFLPVEVIDAAVEPQVEVAEPELEIALAGGHRLTVRGSFDPYRLAALIAEDQQLLGRYAIGQYLTAQGHGRKRRELRVQRGEDGFADGGHVCLVRWHWSC